MTESTPTRPLVLSVVGGGRGPGDETGRFALALAQRIERETGLRAGVAQRVESPPEPLWEVLVLDAGLPTAVTDADFVLLLSCDATAGEESAWRDRLIDAGLAWARVGTAGGNGTGRFGGAGSVESVDATPDTALDATAALDAALDSTAPLLRRRARPGTGLFTRLARRDAEHAGWRWACDSCDVPECEHALRVASRMDSGAALR